MNFKKIINFLKEAKQDKRIEKRKFTSQFAISNFYIFDIKQFKKDEVNIDDLKIYDDYKTVLESLFDDEWNVKRYKNINYCIYLEIVKTKSNAPKGSGTELMKEAFNKLNIEFPNSIYCLYASPISQNTDYSDEENKIILPKLKKVYSNLGFIEIKKGSSVMIMRKL